MMNLAEYRRTATRLADYLPWAALAGSGVVLNKDGSFQRTARFRGPDLDSSVAAELVAVAGRINNALRRLGSGWSIFVEAQRSEAATYPESLFPDPASALVDAERRAAFEEAGAHFVSGYFLTFLWLPPAEESARAETWLYEGREQSGVNPWELQRGFVDRTDRVLALLDGFMPECRWLDDPETLTYLHSTISTNRHRVSTPSRPETWGRAAKSSIRPITGPPPMACPACQGIIPARSLDRLCQVISAARSSMRKTGDSRSHRLSWRRRPSTRRSSAGLPRKKRRASAAFSSKPVRARQAACPGKAGKERRAP